MRRASLTSRKSKRATASLFPSSPTAIISRAKLPTTSSSFRPRRNCSCRCWKLSRSSCSPITSLCDAAATSTSRATLPSPSPWSSQARFRYYRGMLPCCRPCLGATLLLLLPAAFPAPAQTPEPATTSPLREVHVEGEKFLTEAQVIAITGLTQGAPISKGDLQTAADKLVQSGLFAKVGYNFQTKMAGVLVTYHV